MSKSTYIFAGGGTGGHLYPGLAVAQELMKLRPDAQLIFACSDRPIDQSILSPTPYAIVPQPIRPMPRRIKGWAGFLGSLLAARKLAYQLVDDVKPDAVFGLGGFAAVPVVKAAATRGVRSCLLSIDAVPGLANRALARYAEVIWTQFERTAAGYGSSAAKARVIGCPIRSELLAGDREAAIQHFGIRPDRKTLLIMAGSLGAANINQAVAVLVDDVNKLANHWQVLHVSGSGKLEEVRSAYAKATIPHTVVEYCDRMDLAYAASDLVLCRAGASTIGELAATATPAVLMPYPYHRDQQQRHNAQALVSCGGAVMALDACDASANAQLLRKTLLPILEEPSRLARMKEAAARQARGGAAAQIAAWLCGDEGR